MFVLWILQLSETKIFTASNVAVAAAPPPQENVTITKGQRWVESFVLTSALRGPRARRFDGCRYSICDEHTVKKRLSISPTFKRGKKKTHSHVQSRV